MKAEHGNPSPFPSQNSEFSDCSDFINCDDNADKTRNQVIAGIYVEMQAFFAKKGQKTLNQVIFAAVDD